MIIGLTGLYASGKTEAASYLKEKGFIHLSFSAEMAEECKNRNLAPTRENLINIANEMRAKFGAGYWAKKLVGKMQREKNYVVESIRNPAETEVLRTMHGFFLLLVEAPDEKRFERITSRSKEAKEQKDIGSLEEFKQREEKERQNANSSAQQLDECAKQADERIVNDASLQEFHKRIERLVKQLKEEEE